jgi:predicted metal-dependent enzyme (double-stranded beta helix superfamily)
MAQPQRLQEFVAALEALVDAGNDEPRILAGCREAMKRLVAADDWLPEELARPHPQYYQQYLLHRDPRDRFSVVSFVWGPGQ